MELKEFIKTAISDITGAVSELQSELQNGAVINPKIDSHDGIPFEILSGGKSLLMHLVKFDISVSVSESIGKGKKGSIGINVISAGIGKNSENSSEATSRISFEIPVCFPEGS